MRLTVGDGDGEDPHLSHLRGKRRRGGIYGREICQGQPGAGWEEEEQERGGVH